MDNVKLAAAYNHGVRSALEEFGLLKKGQAPTGKLPSPPMQPKVTPPLPKKQPPPVPSKVGLPPPIR